ncbi:fatty acid-binding protein DegV [Anaerosporomusa subterranea]|uniref:Fatty acid-binding protein DegV n=1 Tax=Anaerosporomusa subterranea TaxID=1794912 RepID=A0A154BLE8_ANASB|nr:DegV family protein [Anaerosporomusa subterranea]KYZ74742.1 fatty acid-binding protein DegV [Anaerosporomusa subterranea]
MPKVHIVIDSTANVPQTMLEEHKNLHVVPLAVMLGHRQWREDQIDNTDLFSLIRETGEFPKTSQPAPGEFIRIFEPIIGAGDDIVVITLSSGLSGTVQSAQTAAQSIDPKRIRVVDSGTTAIGMVRMAQQALLMAAAGKSAVDIANRMERVSQATHTLFVPATLEYLHKGGRIGGAAALLGTILQIRPVLYLNSGKVAVLDKVRTWTKAINRIVEEVKQHNNPEYIGIVHLDAPEEAEKLQLKLQEVYPADLISVSTGGAVLSSHLGPGLVGVILQDSTGA